MTSSFLSIRKLKKSYGEVVAVDDVSLEIPRGEFLTFLGPSGSGKSTTLYAVAGFDEITSGDILLEDRSILGVPPNRRNIGMVFQSFALWPHLSVLDNVMLSPIHVQKRDKKLVREEAMLILQRVGLQDHFAQFPAKLSGGQKQRVGIARALAMKPEVLLLDEPTSALDPMLVGEVLSVIQSLALEQVTMVIVTHEMHFAKQVSNRVVFMDQGRVVESAPPEQFFNHPQTDKAQKFLSRFHGLSH